MYSLNSGGIGQGVRLADVGLYLMRSIWREDWSFMLYSSGINVT